MFHLFVADILRFHHHDGDPFAGDEPAFRLKIPEVQFQKISAFAARSQLGPGGILIGLNTGRQQHISGCTCR